MNGHFTAGMALLGITLAAGISAGAFRLAGGMADFRKDRTIRVKGYAEQSIRADTASWACELVVRRPVMTEASALLTEQTKTALALMEELGLTGGSVRRFPVDVQIAYRMNDKGVNTSEIDSYVLRQRLEVQSREVAVVEKASREISTLLSRGIEIVSWPPAYTCSSLEPVKMDLLGRATGNGSERAVLLARNSGGRVGRLESAQQGVFQIVPVDSTDVSDYGSYDTTTIDKTIKAVVTLEFSLD